MIISTAVKRGVIMVTELVHVGFNNFVAINRVIAIASPNSAPTKRTVQEGKTKGLLVDMTNGRKTKAVIIADTVILFRSPLPRKRLLADYKPEPRLSAK